MSGLKRIVRTKDAPEPAGAYSQAVIKGNLVFVSGQLPKDPATNHVIDGDVAQQTERVLRNIEIILRAAGASLDNVVKLTVYLADLAQFEAMNTVYSRFFPTDPPARTTIGAQLRAGAKIVVDAIAVIE